MSPSGHVRICNKGKVLSGYYYDIPLTLPSFDSFASSHVPQSSFLPTDPPLPSATSLLSQKKPYKKVANRIKPVATTLPAEYRIVRRDPPDILADLSPLPTHPPDFSPSKCYTQERFEKQNIDPTNWLWPEEKKLAHFILRDKEFAFAWEEPEKGRFSSEWFDPVIIPTVEHVPWALRNIPIPPGIYSRVIDIIKDKIASGVYEDSSSSYRSRWFCPRTRYELADSSFETIPENPVIRRFVYEHLSNMYRLAHRMMKFGGTFSGKKVELCVSRALIVGHNCTYTGREPDNSRVQKIKDWPRCKDLTEVRGFLGTLGVMRIFIKDFATHARPLIDLTKKDTDFAFTSDHIKAMDTLKRLAISSPALRPIDHSSAKDVILAVGYILSQIGNDSKRYPSRFGSITWNERESRYSQAKNELYGLFRALQATKLWLVGVKKLVVEVDAKYIKGMINNPDIHPNATINRWIAGILLFDFELRHVPGKSHAPADGLSR
ncbi:hypothetical protein CCMSSC00406_0009390 [Pleurotus cornucopiae]|uniref:Uncharacterized protein n=1 Tax=Pleurotus cornucopiae TaxID=5321 RepID=A0ACB7IQP4_PLECO|nr:hypothetical protein CCMSSC00406_0009390 [Pleurotus cornucopiae]